MIFAANNLPALTDADETLYSRYRILDYKYTVPPEKRIPHLEQKLLEEKGALLGFFIEGARRFIKNGCQFTYRSESEKKLLQQLRSKDSFASFADEMLVADPYAELTSAEIINAYTDYCREHGYKPLSNNVWSRQLIEMFDAEHKAIGHSGSKGYKGVRFR